MISSLIDNQFLKEVKLQVMFFYERPIVWWHSI